MEGAQLPVKYVLYSHFGMHETADEAAFLAHGGRARFVETDKFRDYLPGLKELLNTPGHEGLLVLFYAPGFPEFLEEIARRDRRKAPPKLRFAAAVAAQIKQTLVEVGLEERVRFITSLDLQELLGSVHPNFAENFRSFITGSAPGLRYDAPKIVEAIIRLRLLGTGVPVFRVDQDVIFGSENVRRRDLGLFKAIACSVRAYQMRMAHPNVSTFLFSASYDQHAVVGEIARGERFTRWGRAFATRVFPAVVADPVEIRDISHLPQQEQDEAWVQYLETHLDQSLARRFYGLSLRRGRLRCNAEAGLSSIGAHPLYAVISGALLCLSEAAILDLPPFSNFRNNVMWIDDHLKYSLHRAMNHFTSRERVQGEPSLSFARLEEVTLTKSRPPVTNLHVYVFGSYLPTLLWGAVMDAWITDDPLSKRRIAELGSTQRARRDAARQRPPTALLPRTLYHALQVGRFVKDKPDLKREFEAVALARINEVRRRWGALRTRTAQTFASYWARGEVKAAFGADIFPKYAELLWQGIAPREGHDVPLVHLNQIPELRPQLTELVEDALDYVTWTLEWPRFVQIVRTTRQGDFAADVSWQPR
ncbi:MAG TPA: hypothetical protein VFR37_02445 [Longimicrobium sp.]|nr:hypothetical protein [Longimicrobium sp.]